MFAAGVEGAGKPPSGVSLGLGQPPTGGDDFVQKFDAAGTPAWTRAVGTSPSGETNGVSVDALGDVFVTGFTTRTVAGQTSAGGTGAFVMHLVP